GITAIAVERYRLANGRWPQKVDELAPRYLSSVPVDPLDPLYRQKLRYVRMADGVLIYTLGGIYTSVAVEDKGGLRYRLNGANDRIDLGIQLWDAQKRRHPR